MEIIEQLFTKHLHGSGFDGRWSVERLKNGKLKACIDYHHLNEHGYYDGWSRVNVVFDFLDLLESDTVDFKMTFTADKSTRSKYLWDTNYFEDSIRRCLDLIQMELSFLFELKIRHRTGKTDPDAEGCTYWREWFELAS